LLQHECRFGNLETTIHDREGYPEAFPGGGYAMASPICLKNLNDFGFNLMSTANNHAMDYSHNGLLATCKYLKDLNIAYSGTGANLSDASAPTFIDCQDGRVALI
jgi:poly-gamma-glutamate synthesis protein (capsule biosynthesis protein)